MNGFRSVLLALATVLCGTVQAEATDLLGKYWFPDKDGQVEIYEEDDGVYMGRVISYEIEGQIDENNPDPEKRGQPFVGSLMFEGFTFDSRKSRWSGGTIYDASEGKVYKCRLWFEDGDTSVLQARGYIGAPMFGRTAEFKRVSAN